MENNILQDLPLNQQILNDLKNTSIDYNTNLDMGVIQYNTDIDMGQVKVVQVGAKKLLLRYASKSEFPNVGDDNILYIALDENSSYIWKDNKYVCIGRDYTEIEQINGGGA